MNVDSGSLKLVSRGSNSDVFRYGSQNKAVILKVVASQCRKETRHLANEYRILSGLDH